jgi:predicted ATPase/class 3 adenylate cyclase
MSDFASIYIPIDRRQAMASGESLPNRTVGAALFADISGFTPLTEALAKELGRRRGAEELTRVLNMIYGRLITEVERYQGSVIGFSGDAITCWLDGDDGRRATACALSMQQVMRKFATIKTPSGLTFPLAIKVAIAAGPARRFRVGSPEINYLDVLAGATLDRLAEAEQGAGRGEVVVSAEVVDNLNDDLQISEWRDGEEPGTRFALVKGLNSTVQTKSWPELAPDTLLDEDVRRWILPDAYERVIGRQARFLAELRPAVAVFLRFGGIDYDEDDEAGEKLDAYVRWVQDTAAQYDGSLMQISIGDKGSYFCLAFGAPIAHEDDVARAALAALQLRSRPPELDFIDSVQIGISKGLMRVGPYGGPTRRTYGIMGDHANLAARLMQNAAHGSVLVSLQAQKDAVDVFEWEDCPPLRVKGKSTMVTVFHLLAPKARQASALLASRYTLPLVGRKSELARVERRMDAVMNGRGQIVGITAEAGMGKSRLVAEIMHRASDRELGVFIGECQSYGANISYLVWRDIWQDFFGIDPAWSLERQLQGLEASLLAADPVLVRRLPLLGVALNLPIPDNDLTQSMDAELRKVSLEALLVDCLKARAGNSPLVLVLEDAQWMDPLSDDLLEEIGRAIANLPILIVMTYRPPEVERLQAPPVTNLPYCTILPLTQFTPEEAERLIHLKLAQLTGIGDELPASFLERITERAQGNPFYVEELINYFHDHTIDAHDTRALEELDLPSSLQSLILSRIDRLSESQRITLKVASVIGRIFRRSWLWGVDPELGEESRVDADLRNLNRIDLTPLDQIEPEVQYLFKHIVTRQVAYDSLPYATRALLHEQLASFIENITTESIEQYVDLLAYHYDLSQNEDKKREYLRKAGVAAQAAYANSPAIDYYRRLLPLLPEDERVEILLKLGEVLELVGEWGEASENYDLALKISENLADRSLQAKSQSALGILRRKEGNYAGAEGWLKQAHTHYEFLADLVGTGRVLAEMGEVYRLWGDYAQAAEALQRSLQILNSVLDKRDRMVARTNVLKSAGSLANQQGDPARARHMYQESLAILRELDDRPHVAALLNNLGNVAIFQEDYAAARPLFEESLAIMREIGYRSAVGQILNNLALVVRYQGDNVTAREMLEESVAIRRALGDKWGIANALSSLTNLLIHQGKYEGVGAMLEESLLINQNLGDRTAIAYCLEDFAGLSAGTGHPERALRLAGAAAALREDIGGPLPAGEEAALDRILEPARASLDEDGRAAAWESGQAMKMEEAIAEALSATK